MNTAKQVPLNTRPPTEADVETSSVEYRRRFAGEIGAYLLSVQSAHIQQLLAPLSSSASVLDVGGGHGQVVEALSTKGASLTVLGSQESCRELLKDTSAGFVQGSLQNFPFGDRSFDAVVCIRYLTHTEHWEDTLSELCRVSRRYVLIEYPPLISFNITYKLLFRIKRKLEGDTRTFTLFHDSELTDVAAKNAFILKKRTAQFFWPMVLHRKLKSPNLSKILEFLPRILGLTNCFGSPAFLLFEKQVG